MVVIVTILGGLVLFTIGVALLLVGEVPFLAGTTISAVRSRLIGGVWVSFLPLAFGVRAICAAIFGADAVDGPVVTAFVFSFCCLVTFVILFRVLVPAAPPRKVSETPAKPSAPAKANPFADAGPAPAPPASDAEILPWMDEQPDAAPPKKASKKSSKPAGGKDPFDFS
ncbi:MAG: hypothetical protein HYR84_02500 [Planctomycetes bacterium]|nr:hypothetical protein [Planctomycetota bacterium]